MPAYSKHAFLEMRKSLSFSMRKRHFVFLKKGGLLPIIVWLMASSLMLPACSSQTKVNCPSSYDQVFGIKGIKDPNKKAKYKRVKVDKNGLAKKKEGYYK